MTEPKRCPVCGAILSSSDGDGPCESCRASEPTAANPASPTGPATTGLDVDVSAKPFEPEATTERAVGSSSAAEASTADAGDQAEGDEFDLPAGAKVRYFGDYEILGEIGRGGMGYVYRARQMSLHRLVALKMVRAGVLAGDDELRRFRNEAEAVAQLDHPGVVPIYEVGEHQGQHFFSMKLVNGGNLAGLLDRYREAPRAAALLVAEAAEAVSHAHLRGILHRDLKPANLLVDEEGRPHVTDFGLAKLITADEGMTASGAVLGTPAYMSPEQAGGRRGSITTAADVYGLGAVLYAALTGGPPFGGDSILDTLQAVREQPPEPPRRRNPRVPQDLETICLKCLEKDPKRRYASAQALADDLRAWLDDRPIAARRTGVAERAWLWCKRRPAVASLAAATLLAIVAGTATTIAVQAKAHRDLSIQLEATRKAETLAEERLERAMAAIKEYYTGFAEEALAGEQIPRPLRERLLARPLQFYEELTASLATKPNPSPRERELLAEGRVSLGRILGLLGRPEQSRRESEAGIQILERLATERPGEAAIAFELAGAYQALGVGLHEMGERRLACEAFRKAIARCEPLEAAHPEVEEYRASLSESQHQLGAALLRNGEAGPAREAIEQAIARRRAMVEAHPQDPAHQGRLAASYVSLGSAFHLGESQPSRARDAYLKAIDLYESLVKAHPEVAAYRAGLSLACNNIGGPLSALGVEDASRDYLQRSIELREALAAELPGVPSHRDFLGMSYFNLGTRHRDKGEMDLARAAYKKSIDVYEPLAASYPEEPEYRAGLGDSYSGFSRCLAMAGELGPAREAIEKAVVQYEEVGKLRPNEPDFQNRLAGGYSDLGGVLNDMGQSDRAAEVLEKALPRLEALYKAHPEVLEYRAAMADACLNLGTTLMVRFMDRKIGPEPALDVIHRAIEHYKSMCQSRPGLDVDQLGLARSFGKLAIVLKYAGEREKALEAYEAAIARLDALAVANPRAEVYRRDLSNVHMNLGMLLRVMDRHEESETHFRKSLSYVEEGSQRADELRDLIRKAEAAGALLPRLDALLQGKEAPRNVDERLALGQICYDRSLFAASARFWGEALRDDPAIALDRKILHRYNAACSAAMAGAGKGKGVPAPDAAAQAALRAKALGWLRDELACWADAEKTSKTPADVRAETAAALQQWRNDPDLAGVRDPEALAALPDAERDAWRAFWDEVDRRTAASGAEQ